jgi:2-phospho-L-lactate guanylyltransferase
VSEWRAVVPLNLGGACKTRLSGELSEDQRRDLMLVMARHVIAALRSAGVAEVAVLSPQPHAIAGAIWLRDGGRGLNPELASVLGHVPTVMLHADLPLLTAEDIELLLREAQRHGAALAGDRADEGTNAVALCRPQGFVPAFGEGSLARHRRLLPHAVLVKRPGLSLDIDTPDDLAFARATGAHCLTGAA